MCYNVLQVKGGKNMTTFTVRLPENLRKELEQVSRDEKIPTGQLVRQSINRYLGVLKFRKLRKNALPFAEARGLITDEDIFKALKR